VVECAVILAAGSNRRMAPITFPKALLPLEPLATTAAVAKGSTFLSRHVDLLERAGLRRIFVVMDDRNAPAFASHLGSREIVELVSSRFTSYAAGSSLSLLCGLDAALSWRAPCAGTLVMDADTVYENELISVVLSDCDQSRLFTSERVAGDSEEVRVYGRTSEQPVLIGKGLPSTLTSDLTLIGESLGLIYLAPPEQRYCRELIRWLAGEPPNSAGFGFSGVSSEHEELWQYLFSLRRLGIGVVPGTLMYAECDTPDDYERIRSDVFPTIIQRDRERGVVG